jgi:hypothetical protein
MFLPWIMNYNTMKLTCKVVDGLEYEALDGGTSGFTKTFNGVVTHVPEGEWDIEKRWLSNNYGHIIGEYKPDWKTLHQDGFGKLIPHQNGTDPDGGRYDHMQRSEALMLCKDMASIGIVQFTEYETPDCGLTIYKRIPIKSTETNMPGDQKWYVDHPQPCAMRPKVHGRKLSSYDELIAVGFPLEIVEKCRQGKFKAPDRPDLQKYYVYPTT